MLDKPEGRTSFAMVRLVRRLLGIKKVGHAGTLDPFATGLLVICAGRPATRTPSPMAAAVATMAPSSQGRGVPISVAA